MHLKSLDLYPGFSSGIQDCVWKQLSWPTAAGHGANGIGSVPGMGQVCSKKFKVPSTKFRTAEGNCFVYWNRKQETRGSHWESEAHNGGKRFDGLPIALNWGHYENHQMGGQASFPRGQGIPTGT